MKKFYYYDKELIKEQKVYCLYISDKKLSEEKIQEINENQNNLLKNYVIYESEEQFQGYPILENDILRKATDRELVELGITELAKGEILEGNNIIKVPQPSWQHKWDFKNLKWIPDENTLHEGQYINGEEIVTVPYDESLNFIHKVFNKTIHVWEEGATKEEFIETRKNKILEYTELEKQKKALETSKFSSENEILIITDKMKILEQEINNLALKINSLKD